nr:RNA-directed DNA polymerase, eukaryota [Tanacetum cinerariifolium]
DEEDLSDDESRDVDSKKKNLETCGDDNDLEEDSPELNINLEQSLKYLPAFTPNEESDTLDMNKEDSSSKMRHTGLAQKAKTDWVKELCAKHKVSFLALPETKMENMANSTVKMCWGNLAFNFVHSDSVGLAQKAKKDWVKELCAKDKVNILALQETKMENMANSTVKMCWGNDLLIVTVYAPRDLGEKRRLWDYLVHDCNSFRKVNVTVLDSFILIRGVWLKTSNDLLIVTVYAPQDLGEKRRLWDYLVYVIQKWHGKVVIMGDFNKVRFKSNRFGLVFNSQGANAFNSFIANAGLEEIPLGGSAFTWCHKSATKMSKLDRFLISENLLKDAWCKSPCNESNAMLNLIKKLKYLKSKIQEWNKNKMSNMKIVKENYKRGLEAVEMIIDKDEGNDDIVNTRMGIIKSLQDVDKHQAMELAQKAKVQWFWKIIGSDVFEAVNQFFTLGTQVGGTMSRVQAWNNVIDKVQNRLSKWKLNALSIAGSKKESWVKWNNVMASKEKGGLGVASLYALNRGDSRNDGKVGKVDHSRSRSYWLNIVHEINELEKQGIKHLDHMKVKLGNGDKKTERRYRTRAVRCLSGSD